jgi:hypothetical protein
MAPECSLGFATKLSVVMLLMAIIILFTGCHHLPDRRAPREAMIPALSSGSSSTCIAVKGIVIGDLFPGSRVYLYETSGLNFSVVMTEIRTTQPISWEIVHESRGFEFHCVSLGTYALVIPTSSYKGAVGSPLPYEFDCRNFSLRIAFQGGDPHYAVGAFSIEKTSSQIIPWCIETPLSYPVPRKGLYRECQLLGLR